MRKIYLTILAFIFSFSINAQCPTFSISAPGGTVVGCNPSTVLLMTANTSTISGVTYTWVSASTGSLIGSTINASCPGATNVFTVLASAPSTSCVSSQTFTISSLYITPTCSIVGAATKTLGCGGACQSFTAVTISTANITGNWYAPGPSTIVGPTVTPMRLCVNAPGTYTAEFCSTISGCCSTQTVAVYPTTGVPSLSVTPISAYGYTLNCISAKVILDCFTNSTVGPFGYTWTPLPSPPGIPVSSSVGGFTATTPGQYQVSFVDGNFCPISSTVTVYIDTLRPSPFSSTSLAGNGYTLNCYTPTLVATALTNPMLPLSNYSWTQPPSLTIPSNTVSVSLANITSSTAPSVYTVSAMGNNGCVGKAKVNFYKNDFVPYYNAVFTPSAITCNNPCVAMSPSSSSTVAVTFTFTSPPPTQTATTSGALFCIPGTYSMSYVNILNGCGTTATVVVPNNAVPPATFAVGPYIIPCGSTSTNITAGTNSLNPAYTYSWTGPVGANMNNPSGYFTSADMSGTYTVLINNFTTGCNVYNYVSVSQTTILTVPISGQDTICVGYGTNLFTNVPAATSYSWNTGSTSNTIWVSPTVTTVYSIVVTNTTAGCSGSNSFTVTVDPCVGINELEWNKNISIAPNPNNGKFTINIGSNIVNGELKIINSIGQEVFKQNIRQGKNEISTGTLANGVYYYNIYQNKQPVSRGKIVIE